MPGHLAGCGSFLIFAACALLVVATVSVPIFRPITLLNLDVDGTPITFGVFGYCVGNSGGCSERKLGYGIPSVVSLFTQSSLYTEINNIVPRLTTALVLHPIAAGIAFLAFLIAACSERLGYLCSSLLCFLAFIVSALALALDLAINIVIRQKISQYATQLDGIEVSSSFGNAVWMTTAATACLLVGTFVVCFGVCSGRARRSKGYAEPRY